MTTILKGSVLSLIKLEKLQLNPVDRQIARNDVRYYVRKKQFYRVQSRAEAGRAVSWSSHDERGRVSNGLSSRACSTCALSLLALYLLGYIVRSTFPYPLHASCLIKWEFSEPCVFVYQRLRSQIIKWSNYKSCGTKCLYKINEALPYTNDTIRAIHISLKYNIVDDIDIIFGNTSNNSCTALADSSSQVWYALFDEGRNYCNLHDLIVGAQYEDSSNFIEFTNNLICTEYDTAYCH